MNPLQPDYILPGVSEEDENKLRNIKTVYSK
jgi:hypothetical protein